MHNIYPPSEDSELLLEVLEKEIRRNDVFLEVGTGSGFVAEKLVGRCKKVVATDISPLAVKEAKKRGIDVILTDLFSGLKRVFTLVAFNPPYLELSDFEKRGDWIEKAIDGGKGGIEVALKFVNRLDEVLVEGGRAVVILSSLSDLRTFLKNCSNYEVEVVGRKKLFFEELFAFLLKSKK